MPLISYEKLNSETARLPSLTAFLVEVDALLARNTLTPSERTVARAFATAVYRRAFARRKAVEVQAVVNRAISTVTRRACGVPTVSTRKKRSYVYGFGYSLSPKRKRRPESADSE